MKITYLRGYCPAEELDIIYITPIIDSIGDPLDECGPLVFELKTKQGTYIATHIEVENNKLVAILPENY